MSNDLSLQRTKNYFLQLKSSVIYKILGIVVSFVSIPLMIKYLGNEQYGIWSTILGIFSWIVLFDIGVGNGVRNKLAESLAKENKEEAQKYVSTGYISIGILSMSLLVLFNIVAYFINWQIVFNTIIVTNSELYLAVSLAGTFLIVNFWLSLINQISNGLQKSQVVVFNQFLSNLLSLFFVFILYKFTEASLIKLILFYGFSLLISNFLVTYWIFKNYEFLIPKVKYFSKEYIKSITSLGFKFFIIQIAVVVIFTTDKIMITQLFGPEYVTNYDVVFKLFSIITIGHSLILAPLWSSCSDSYHRGDIEWIKNSLFRQLQFFILIILGTIVLSFIAKYIITFWIGKNFIVDDSLIYAMAIFVIVSTWNNIFGFILGGLNYIRLGAYYTVLTAVLNIPISYYYAKILDFGVSGIVIGTVTSILISALFSPIQVYYFIFSKKRTNFLDGILK